MKDVFIALVVLLVIAAAVGYLSSPEYALEKSIRIRASPEALHDHLSDLKNWPAWFPWQAGSGVQTKYSHDTVGEDARMTWTAPENTGGELTLTRCDEQGGLAYDMVLVQGDVRAAAAGTLTYRPYASTIEVKWTVDGTWEGLAPRVVDGLMKVGARWTVGSKLGKGLEALKREIETGS